MTTTFSYSKKYFSNYILITFSMICIGTASYLSNPSYLAFIFLGFAFIFSLILVMCYYQKYIEWGDNYLQTNLIYKKKFFLKDLKKIHFKDETYFFDFKNKTIEVKKQNIKKEELPLFESKYREWKDQLD